MNVSLVPEMRKPFDVLAEGLLVSSSRGDWIRTSDLLNPIQETTPPNPMSRMDDASSASFGCTTGCTSETKPEHAGSLEQLAAALEALSPADRARLAAILGQKAGEDSAEMGTP